jgi:hypothetical protein
MPVRRAVVRCPQVMKETLVGHFKNAADVRGLVLVEE